MSRQQIMEEIAALERQLQAVQQDYQRQYLAWSEDASGDIPGVRNVDHIHRRQAQLTAMLDRLEERRSRRIERENRAEAEASARIRQPTADKGSRSAYDVSSRTTQSPAAFGQQAARGAEEETEGEDDQKEFGVTADSGYDVDGDAEDSDEYDPTGLDDLEAAVNSPTPARTSTANHRRPTLAQAWDNQQDLALLQLYTAPGWTHATVRDNFNPQFPHLQPRTRDGIIARRKTLMAGKADVAAVIASVQAKINGGHGSG